MKMKKQFFLSLGAALVLVGCGDDKSALQDVDFPTELQSQDFYSQHLDQAKATNQQCKQVLKTNKERIGQLFEQQQHEIEVMENPELVFDVIGLYKKHHLFMENCANAMVALLLAEPNLPKTTEEYNKISFYHWWENNYEESWRNKNDNGENGIPDFKYGSLSSSVNDGDYQAMRVYDYKEYREKELESKFEAESKRLEQEYLNQQLEHYLQLLEQEWANINWQQGINKLISIKPNLGYDLDKFENLPTLKEIMSAYLAKEYGWRYFDERKSTSDSDKKYNKERRDGLFLSALYVKYYYAGLKELLAKSYSDLLKDKSYCQLEQRSGSACDVYKTALQQKWQQQERDYMMNFDRLKTDFNQCVAKMENYITENNLSKRAEDLSGQQIRQLQEKKEQIFQAYPCDITESALKKLALEVDYINKLN
ncbi:hypothetical protein [Lonepinella sp. BR2271]|uniref:hypothetical protein n=1 Tax=Lonepinella sp. BR2271 TaxID=3434550 RepID=UPI003F6DD430